jgi:hypothetical protein
MTTALEGGEWSAARPGRTLPPGKTRYQLYRRLGGTQGRSGQVRKISPPPGFDPRTVQPGSSVAIPTELPGPPIWRIYFLETGDCVVPSVTRLVALDGGKPMYCVGYCDIMLIYPEVKKTKFAVVASSQSVSWMTPRVETVGSCLMWFVTGSDVRKPRRQIT